MQETLSCKLNIPPLIASFRVVFCINGSTAAHSSQQKRVFIGTLQEALTESIIKAISAAYVFRN